MNKKLTIEPKVRRLVNWIESINKGSIQVPQFQRDYVWDLNAIKDLFDSIKLGYPIGSILLWKPENETFDRSNEIGGYSIKEPKDSSEYWYILDGFQRLSTLYGCLTDPNKDNQIVDLSLRNKKFNIFYDLMTEEFLIPRSESMIEPYQVPLYSLIDTKAAFSFQTNLIKNNITEENVELYMERYADLGSSLIDYEVPSITIDGGHIKEAVDIFSRVNSKGTEISPDWMISALTYSKDSDFRLGSLIDELLLDLEEYNFHDISNGRDLILKCITHSFGKAYFDQSNRIEQLALRPDFIEVTRKTISSIKKAVEFLNKELLVLNGKQLPYVPQLIFITDFFNTLDTPSTKQINDLKRWFWVTTYSNYFTIYTISKQREAYKQFRDYLNSETDEIVFNDKPELSFKTAEFPIKINAGSVRSNALILFLLNYFNDFQSNNEEFTNLSLSYLFSDIKNDKRAFYPASVIPIANRTKKRIPKFIKLDEFDGFEKSDKFFVSEEMIVKYQLDTSDESKKEILEMRQRLIQKAERDFVESLGIEYDGS
ncbi:DUF262 domain-containing protein [Cognaticolwellia aestuarii]|uniref:DUF262 domain-containing protein n=1 Tax=Cognaticolwellia aestuarii TaxID=329993 RepID=UPI0009857FD8|nr:DUF262 domain-containing protein [Cognaticolwellia aestuarii]